MKVRGQRSKVRGRAGSPLPAAKRETIKDIVRELRETNVDLATRIKAAWEHEKCEIEGDALNAGGMVAMTILKKRAEQEAARRVER